MRKKVIIQLGITILLLGLLYYFVVNVLVIVGIDQADRESLERNTSRIRQLISHMNEQLGHLASEWANQDDADNFIDHLDQVYNSYSQGHSSLYTLKVDLAMYVDAGGEIIYGKSIDSMAGEDAPLPEGFDEYFIRQYDLLEYQASTTPRYGIVIVNQVPVMVASHAVMNSDEPATGNGWLILGKYLNAAAVQQVSQVLSVDVVVYPLNDHELPPQIQKIGDKLLNGVPIVAELTQERSPDDNEGIASGYTLMPSISGEPALILQVDAPRYAHDIGMKILLYLGLALLVTIIAMSALIYFFLERNVISRLLHLRKEVVAIGESRDFNRRVAFRGEDELTDLAVSINQMTHDLDQSLTARTVAERQFRDMLENIGLIAIMVDDQCRATYCNPYFYQLTGWRREEIIGKICFENIVHPEDRAKTSKHLEEGLAGEISSLHENRILERNGGERLIRWFSTVLKDSEGGVSGVACIGEDITELRKMDEVLRRSRAKLEDQVRERTSELEKANLLMREEIVQREKVEEALRQSARNLSVLYEIAVAVSGTVDLIQALDTIIKLVLKELKMDGAVVCQRDSDSGKIMVMYHIGVPDKHLDLIERMNVIKKVIDSGKSIYMDDIQPGHGRKMKKEALLSSGAAIPIIYQDQTKGILLIGCNQRRCFNPQDVEILGAIGRQIGIAIGSAEARLQSQELTIVDERQRIAWKVHDSISQMLYSLTLFAKAGRYYLRESRMEELENCLEEVEENAMLANREMRLLLHGLQPTGIIQKGLAEALQNRIEMVEKRSDIEVTLDIDCQDKLPIGTQIELYWIAIEALNNVLRHASASLVSIRLSSQGDTYEMEIKDNGSGFEPSQIEHKGLGSTSMQQRAKQIGGEFVLQTAPGEGTTILVRFANQAEKIPIHQRL